jgi:hypothetical protein
MRTSPQAHRWCLALLGILLFAQAGTAAADTIGFDDIDASAGDVILDNLNPYHGFNFTNFSVYTGVPGFPGYNNGIISGPNAAYTAGDALGSPIVSTITAATAFDFTSAYLGSGWYNGMGVTLIGLSGGTQVYDQSVTVNTAGAQLFTFNFTGITELDIYSTVSGATTDPYGCGPSGCSQITLDDMILTLDAVPPPPPPSPVPEPASVVLTALGILSAAARAHFKQSHS